MRGYPGVSSLIRAVFLACGILATVSSAGAQEITVGLMAELSGSSASNGEDCRRGYEVASSLLAHNGLAGQHRVRIVYGDHQGDAKTGVSEFNRLVNAERAWAVATNRSQIGMALNPLSARRHIPLLGTVVHNQFLSDSSYAWRFFPSAEAEASALARKALQMGLRRAAILTLQDEWTLALANSFRENFIKGGGETVYFETLTPSDYDLASVISRVGAAAPDSILTSFTVNDSGLVIRKLREQGLHQQIFANVWATKKDEEEDAR